MTTTTDAELRERYGAPAPWRRNLLIAVLAVVVVAFAAWLVWTIRGQADPAVSSQLVTFDVVDDDSATAQIDIDLTTDVQAVCSLQAFAEDHTLVGTSTFLPPIVTGTHSYHQTIKTVRSATTVSLVGCTAPGQPRPR